MPDTPLNNDALEVALRSVCSYMFEGELADKLSDNVREGMRQHFATVVSAYLAVAQPVVSSVEELDALPVQSVIRTDKGWVYERRGLGWMTTGLPAVADLSTNTLVPATVIYRPEKESSDGR